MAESNGSGATAIVAIVALILVGVLVWFFFLSGGDAPVPDGPDVEINVENPLPDAE